MIRKLAANEEKAHSGLNKGNQKANLEPEKERIERIEQLNKKMGKRAARPEEFNDIAKNLNFLEIKTKFIASDAKESELTQLYLDRTPIIKKIIETKLKGDFKSFLGELQISFITFLIGEELGGFEQWKKIIQLLCYSEKYVYQKPELYAEGIRCIFSMIKQFPKDFFFDILSKNNFVGNCLKNLYCISQDEKCHLEIKNRMGYLKKLLEENFGYPLEEFRVGKDGMIEFLEEDEYAPVVVNL